MSKFLESMKRVLVQTGVYDVTDCSFISHELKAYDEGFSIFEDEFESLLRDIFIGTASDAGLEYRELLFRPLKAQADTEARRKMLKTRYSTREHDFTRDKLEQALIGAGIEGRLSENGGLRVDICRRHGMNLPQIVSELEGLLPAHLPFTLDAALVTWRWIESTAKTFGELETGEYTWNEIETLE